jgi:predicted nucleotidyltransferase component of viral defense system
MMEVPVLREVLVFKGGTCLRKAYFASYRFSEDLDFSQRAAVDPDALVAALREAIERALTSLSERGPFDIRIERKLHRRPHPQGQVDCKIAVRYPWMNLAHCTLKVEINPDEPVVLEPAMQQLIHTYSGGSLDAVIPSYRLEEVAAEKLRALLQKRQQIARKGWGANRPRDLYDLRHLWTQDEYPINWEQVRGILPAKAEAREVSFSGAPDFLDGRVLDGIRGDWQGQLANFVPDLPAYEECLGVLRTILNRLF